MQIDLMRLLLLADHNYMLLVAGIRNHSRTKIPQLGCRIV